MQNKPMNGTIFIAKHIVIWESNRSSKSRKCPGTTRNFRMIMSATNVTELDHVQLANESHRRSSKCWILVRHSDIGCVDHMLCFRQKATRHEASSAVLQFKPRRKSEVYGILERLRLGRKLIVISSLAVGRVEAKHRVDCSRCQYICPYQAIKSCTVLSEGLSSVLQRTQMTDACRGLHQCPAEVILIVGVFGSGGTSTMNKLRSSALVMGTRSSPSAGEWENMGWQCRGWKHGRWAYVMWMSGAIRINSVAGFTGLAVRHSWKEH
nr:hypothetical protein CFP56_57064 [Quercus suber]